TDNQVPSATKSGPWRKMLPSKDANFMGYTYKNFEIVNDHEVPGIGPFIQECLNCKYVSMAEAVSQVHMNALCMVFYARSEEARWTHSVHKLALVAS
ncbi:UNVERIFIED_CONTAM: hypothetical protein Sradi_2646100, partial [Sesamum radiatum]